MTSDIIRNAMHSNLPFRVRTADGKVIEVPHQDYVALPPNGRIMIVMTPDGLWEVLDVRLITALETQASDSAA